MLLDRDWMMSVALNYSIKIVLQMGRNASLKKGIKSPCKIVFILGFWSLRPYISQKSIAHQHQLSKLGVAQSQG